MLRTFNGIANLTILVGIFVVVCGGAWAVSEQAWPTSGKISALGGIIFVVGFILSAMHTMMRKVPNKN